MIKKYIYIRSTTPPLHHRGEGGQYHTPTRPQGGRGTLPHPHHTTGGGGGQYYVWPMTMAGEGLERWTKLRSNLPTYGWLLPDEGWCETWHHITIHSMKGGVRLYITQQYTQWRVVWDFTSHNNTLTEGWCETLHHITIHPMKGGVRLDIT